MKKPRFQPPETCPVCGEDVPRNAHACPECGADEETGWSEAARYDGLDLPDEAFDYKQFATEEFGGKPKRSGRDWLWWIVAVVVLAALIWMFFSSAFW